MTPKYTVLILIRTIIELGILYFFFSLVFQSFHMCVGSERVIAIVVLLCSASKLTSVLKI